MGYGTYLKDLLRPMGVYRLDGIGGGELESIGSALDECFERLERAEREMLILTAEDTGLAAIEGLLARRPAAPTVERRREALCALLRVGGDSFTPGAVNDNLKGCGINAVATEAPFPGVVRVKFPDVDGLPDELDELRGIIEDILPCHLEVAYVWDLSWVELELMISTWSALEQMGLTWNSLERLAQ